MWYPALRRVLFSMEPERAHAIVLAALRAAAVMPVRGGRECPVTLMGLSFPNRVGLAAGFDKNAVAVNGLGRLGFGFLEVGTVTPRPQAGQPPPRLFRLRHSKALINRLGFPNDGAEAVAARIRRRRYAGILGVNIGKNADTPLGSAVDDYVRCVRLLGPHANYLAVNISSPNTQSLRELHEPERLEPLLTALLAERGSIASRTGRPLPLLLKISPDLSDPELRSAAKVLSTVGMDGVIATNTTLRRDAAPNARDRESGGMSGAPLHRIAVRVIADLRRYLGPSFPIIGVGGIESASAAVAMRRAGADLIQLYTGLVYRGPRLIRECIRALNST